jgi:hypothetical protein
MTIVGDACAITGGVDTHADVHVATCTLSALIFCTAKIIPCISREVIDELLQRPQWWGGSGMSGER